ncbi:MAG: tetratricopeptide repeat protein, partial [Opitutales bacterium]
ARTFPVPLLFDDEPAILNNASLRHWATALFPPPDTTASGRPVLNLSLALNHALSGTSVWSYHAVNLLIHYLAGLAVFGIVRRTLAQRTVAAGAPLALAVALLWTLHPLQTEAVTYIVQRAESLMGLFYLCTLYGFIRGAEAAPDQRSRWYLLSLTSCFLGMGTKEVMVSAPVVVLLYDRTFLAGSWREVWRCRARVHAGLAATWVILPFLVFSTHGRGGTAGYGTAVSWWSYALTQLPALAHYLRLCFWPHPLVFDYGTALAPLSFQLLPAALLITGLLALTAWALVRHPAGGFLGTAFFVILAPSSSFVPVATETMAEHRMYLPLLAVVVLVVIGLHRVLGRVTLPVCCVLAAGLAAVTWQRNGDYRDAPGLWADTVTRNPANPRAHYNLANQLAGQPDQLEATIMEYQEAVRLQPDYADALNNLGNAWLKKSGGGNEAIARIEAAVRLRPADPDLLNNLGHALLQVPGREQEAVSRLEEALRLRPDYAEAHNNLGYALERLPGRLSDALAHDETALRLRPNFAEARNNLGNVLMKIPGRQPEAIAQYEEALRLNPNFAPTHYNLGNALAAVGRTAEAIRHYEEALRLRPDYIEAHNNLAISLEKMPGHLGDAIAQYEEALRLKPDAASLQINLALALLKSPGRTGEAVPHLEAALRLQPGNEQARQILAWIRAHQP